MRTALTWSGMPETSSIGQASPSPFSMRATTSIGCVYVYPAKDGVHDADVKSWVRESEAALDEALRRAIADWLTSDSWPFERPLYAPVLT